MFIIDHILLPQPHSIPFLLFEGFHCIFFVLELICHNFLYKNLDTPLPRLIPLQG